MSSAQATQAEYVDISTIGIDDVTPAPAPLPSASDKATVSYWMATTSADQLPTPLETLPAQSDVVIIGSGITGVSCAYHLVNTLSASSSTASDHEISSIHIIEARTFCSGATGRNGGHLTTASALAYTDLAANPNHLLGSRAPTLDAQQIKTETARVVEDILNFETHTADAIRFIIKHEQAEHQVGLTHDANWHICYEQAEVDAYEDSLRRASQHAGLQSYVDKVRRVPKSEIDERTNNPERIVAVYEIPGATLHPRALVALIYQRAQRLASENGITLNVVCDSPVLKVDPCADGSILSTEKGQITAKYVVHATNAYASHLLPHLSSPSEGGIIPTRAQVVAVAPIAQKYLWGMALSANGGYEYGHQRPASESPIPLYILGGGREYADGREWGIADDTGLNPQVSHFLHPYLAKTYPNSYAHDVQREWTGIMGYTKSKDPLVGPVSTSDRAKATREFISAGYSGHGMTRAFGCAGVIAQMVLADVKGEKWQNKQNFPDCYLTAGAKAMLVDRAEQVVVHHQDMDAVSSVSETAEKVVQSRDVSNQISSASTSVGCCTVG